MVVYKQEQKCKMVVGIWKCHISVGGTQKVFSGRDVREQPALEV